MSSTTLRFSNDSEFVSQNRTCDILGSHIIEDVRNRRHAEKPTHTGSLEIEFRTGDILIVTAKVVDGVAVLNIERDERATR